MDLILWRHAEAHVIREGQDDLSRALTPKGDRQAQRMADWLNHRMAHATRILVSPALRCQQTAQALGRRFKTLPALGTEATPADLLQAARWPGGTEAVLIIGHQATLGQLSALLMTGQVADWPVKKAGVWWFRGRDREGELQTVLQAVQNADNL